MDGKASLYPLQAFENKFVPLNVCPLCGEWYSCPNHLFAECMHIYQHWYMSSCSRISNQCQVTGCNFTFITLWHLACDTRNFVQA